MAMTTDYSTAKCVPVSTPPIPGNLKRAEDLCADIVDLHSRLTLLYAKINGHPIADESKNGRSCGLPGILGDASSSARECIALVDKLMSEF